MNARFRLLAAAAVLAGGVTAHAADSYPVRPVRMIIPTGAGGVTDILARTVAQKLGESLGQQFVIDNRPGASGIVGSQIVANAAPDGYTLLMVFPSHAVNPSLYASIPYDTATAFAPVTIVSTVGLVLVVPGDGAPRSVAELIALAKAKPGTLNFGSVGSGSLGHLGAELFRSMAGIKLTHIAYKGAPQVISALFGGEVNMYFVATAGSIVPHEKSGRLRALGVSTKERLAILPHVPPIADALPGYEARGWNGILAPARTPPAIIERLNREIVRIVRMPELAARIAAEGAAAVGNTPAEFDAIIRADLKKWATLIREAGIRGEQ